MTPCLQATGWAGHSLRGTGRAALTALVVMMVAILATAQAQAASLTVLYPNGGETVYRYNTYNITWSSSGVTGDIAVDIYSGATNLKRYNVTNTGSFAWTVDPSLFPAGSSYRIGLSAMSGTVYDFSNAYFTIANPSLTVTSPNGGESWDRGSNHTITWTSVGISGNVLVQLYQNGAATSTAWSVANTGSLAWNSISDAGSTHCKIGMSAFSGQVYDFSNADFTILPAAPTVTAPNGGETWLVGSTQRVTWTNPGGYTSFTIEVSRNGGSTWETVETGLPGTYTYRDWVVTGPVSTNCRYRVTGYYDGGSRNDTSNASFLIVQPSIQVVSPNGGQSYCAGSTVTITWISSNVTGLVAIDILDGTTNRQRYNVSNTGSYSWTIDPALFPGSSAYRIGLSAMSGTVYDYSDGYFTINNPTLTVTAPNGGEVWELGSVHNITWTSGCLSGLVAVDIYNGATNLYRYNVSNTGSFSWTIDPAIFPAGTSYTIGLSALSGAVYDYSNSAFTLQPAALTVTSPNGGESWPVGSTQRITWTNPGGYTGFNLEISRDGGSTWSGLETGLPGTYTYRDVTVPAPAANTCRVRVTGLYAGGSRSDISNANFVVTAPTLTVTSPNGSETWHKGWTYAITWNSLNVTGDIAIDLYRGAENYVRLTGTAPNTGTYSWTPDFALPGDSTYRIALSASAGSVWDFSDGYFTLDAPSLTLTSPAGGETWLPGTSHVITWTSQNVLGNVLIQPYLNGVAQTPLTTNTENDGSFSWTIPTDCTASASYTMGISAMSGHVSDFSGMFTIGDVPAPTYPGAAFYSQLDPAWSGQQLGSCSLTIGSDGCALTCVAMLLTWEAGSAANPNPAELNAWLSRADVGGYTGGCYILWDIAANYDGAGTGLQFTASVPNVPDQWSYIDNEVNAARPVVVEVDASPATSGWLQHFVVVYARSGPSGQPQSYLIMDPLQARDSFDPLNPRTLARYTRTSDGNTFKGVRTWSGSFPMSATTLALTSPTGGETWARGSSHLITWNSSNVTGTIQIQPYRGTEALTNIAAGAPNTGSYLWTIPGDFAPGTDYRIAISAMGGVYYDFSGYFTVTAPPTLTVTSPAGGEVWSGGGTYTITWESSNVIGTIQVQPYRGYVALDNIAAGVPNTGSLQWTIPTDYESGADYRIAISALGGTCYDFSEYFTISRATTVPAGAIPGRFALEGPVPNPFNPTTTITVLVPEAGMVTVDIYDLEGRLVRRLLADNLSVGRHDVAWDGRDERGLNAASGMYMCRLRAGAGGDITRMTLVR